MKALLKRIVPATAWADLRQYRDLDAHARREWRARRLARLRGHGTSERLPELQRTAPSIVFICHGNIYRSPMAAALFTQVMDAQAPGLARVASAGLHMRAGRPAPDDARRAAAALGVSLDAHGSSPLDDTVVAAAGLLVVMDRANEAVLATRHPEAAARMVLLGAFAPDGSADPATIPDPYGLGDEAVAACYARIARAVSGLLDAVARGGATHRHAATAHPLRRLARSVVRAEAAAPLWRLFARGEAHIVMLHRFADPEHGVRGHDPVLLARNLEFLRKHRFHVASLTELVARMSAGEPPLPRTVVFTVDDGYADVARVGLPIFARYDVPATTFLVTGFVDGACWQWYDAVCHLMGTEPRGALELPVGEVTLRLRWDSHGEREVTVSRLNESLKRMPTTVVEETVCALAAVTGRALPARPVPRYTPLPWDEARAWAARGMSFGAHTHTHPILSRASDARVTDEVTRSWGRVRAEVPDGAVPVFCYPNGKPEDFGAREMAAVRAAWLQAAVMAHGGPCRTADLTTRRFALPRTSYEESPVRFRQVVGGLDRATRLVRASGDA